ncbi:hypothetical protein COLO4_23421 [Corchorus olitorius]|uniref:Uncharacterized protein n=1 Tax=Corchorus olitorius TaxID=93759 RepID=A0A1R3IGW5_9ROSI|nr:hypothetical protein COLO4_23421 [Corchorus olitorius]
MALFMEDKSKPQQVRQKGILPPHELNFALYCTTIKILA